MGFEQRDIARRRDQQDGGGRHRADGGPQQPAVFKRRDGVKVHPRSGGREHLLAPLGVGAVDAHRARQDEAGVLARVAFMLDDLVRGEIAFAGDPGDGVERRRGEVGEEGEEGRVAERGHICVIKNFHFPRLKRSKIDSKSNGYRRGKIFVGM